MNEKLNFTICIRNKNNEVLQSLLLIPSPTKRNEFELYILEGKKYRRFFGQIFELEMEGV